MNSLAFNIPFDNFFLSSKEKVTCLTGEVQVCTHVWACAHLCPKSLCSTHSTRSPMHLWIHLVLKATSWRRFYYLNITKKKGAKTTWVSCPSTCDMQMAELGCELIDSTRGQYLGSNQSVNWLWKTWDELHRSSCFWIGVEEWVFWVGLGKVESRQSSTCMTQHGRAGECSRSARRAA